MGFDTELYFNTEVYRTPSAKRNPGFAGWFSRIPQVTAPRLRYSGVSHSLSSSTSRSTSTASQTSA
jgi:hypothetical protein